MWCQLKEYHKLSNVNTYVLGQPGRVIHQEVVEVVITDDQKSLSTLSVFTKHFISLRLSDSTITTGGPTNRVACIWWLAALLIKLLHFTKRYFPMKLPFT